MKKLISAIGAFFLAGSLSGQEITKSISQEEVFSKLGIPVRFLNYKEGAEVTEYLNPWEGGVFYLLDYNKNGVCVRESHDISDVLPEGIEVTEYPSMYAFDLNGDGEFQREEVLFDDAADGLNGNEIWFRDKLLEKKYSEI